MAFSFPNPYRYHLDFPVLSSRASGRFLVPSTATWHPCEAIEGIALSFEEESFERNRTGRHSPLRPPWIRVIPFFPLRTLTAHIEKTHKSKWGGITINYPYKSWPGTPGGFDSATDYLGKCVSSRGIETRNKIMADERKKWI